MIVVKFVVDLEVLLSKSMEAPPQRGDIVVLHGEASEAHYRVSEVTWYFGPDTRYRGGGDFVEVRLRSTKVKKQRSL